MYVSEKIAHAAGMAIYEPVYKMRDTLEYMGARLSEAVSGIDSTQPVSGGAVQLDPYVGAVAIGTIGTLAAISYAINRSYRKLPRY